MLIGYARVSKADGSQLLDLQRDALVDGSDGEARIYDVDRTGACPYPAWHDAKLKEIPR